MNSVNRFIAKILSDQAIDILSFPEKNDNKFWDKFVKIGSSHYIIPALYSKFKERNFLVLISDELSSYMRHIYDLNSKRNLELEKESGEISSIFLANNIDHVFLKGAALISSIYEHDIGIRMIGDIDILVKKSQILKAKSILLLDGYSTKNTGPFKPFLNDSDYRINHLQRLINKNKLFAVELHFDLTKNKSIDTDIFIKRKQKSNGIYIPNNINLLNHTIINFQENDNGSLKAGFHFRTLFDVYNLSKTQPHILDKLPISEHLQRIKVVLNNLNLLKFKTPLKLLLFELRFRLIHSFYIFSLINSIIIVVFLFLSTPITIRLKQIKALFLQKDYRKYALKKIRIVK